MTINNKSYEELMDLWDWQHRDLYDAYGSIDALANALRAVAPPPLVLEQPGYGGA
jgi:hypothetical protein